MASRQSRTRGPIHTGHRDTRMIRDMTFSICVCRYEFTTRNQHVVLAAASKKGRIFVAAGSTDEVTFLTAEGRLRAAVDSFMLIVE